MTGIYPPDVGGPANYAKQLFTELEKRGHTVRVATFRFERKLPSGVRHAWFFFKILPDMLASDVVILLDTFSVAIPGVTAARLLRKKTILRTGGDFLWEGYVERTKKKILLGEFYPLPDDVTDKERMIYKGQRYVTQKTDIVAFSSTLQRDVFIRGYDMDEKKTRIIENFYGEKIGSVPAKRKNFIWAGRPIVFKNLPLLKEAFAIAKQGNPDIELEILETMTRDELLEKMKQCYAVIYPSLTEISPNQILESIMCNKPFIVTRDMGLYERVKDLGIFVDPKSVTGVAEAISSLAQDETYARLKKNLEDFTFTHSYGEIAEEFEALF